MSRKGSWERRAVAADGGCDGGGCHRGGGGSGRGGRTGQRDQLQVAVVEYHEVHQHVVTHLCRRRSAEIEFLVAP